MDITLPKKKILSVFYLAYFVRCKVIKKWRKQAKKSKNRFLKLREWSDTQQNYLVKLKTLRDQIKTPLVENNFITEYQEVLIFPNLDAMIVLGEQMKQRINQLIKSWNPVTTLLAPTVLRLVNFLKIYKQYSNNYEKADKIIQELKKKPDFSKIVTVPFIQDYLIKPVQRPLQYNLFIVDYLRSMSKDHKDRVELEKVQQTVLKIAGEINNYVQEQMERQKMIKLEDIFGDIVQTTRNYRFEFYARHLDVRCKIYALNDLLLIAKQLANHRQTSYMKIGLCHGSYIVRKPANKYFSQRIFICGTLNSIHLTFDTKFDLENADEKLKEMVQILYQKQSSRVELLKKVQIRRETMFMNRYTLDNNNYKWKQQHQYKLKLKVTVVGSQLRTVAQGNKIYFFIKIQLYQPGNVYQIAIYDLDELRKVEQYLHYVYKDIQIPPLDMKFKQISNENGTNDFTKYYEYKSIAIQAFLNSVLRSAEISNSPEFVLLKLRIHESLWDYLNKFDDQISCSCVACIDTPEFKNISYFYKIKKQIETANYPYCILKAFNTQKTISEKITQKQFILLGIQDQLLWAACKQKRIIYQLLHGEIAVSKIIQFEVCLNLSYEEEYFPIQQTASCTVRNVIKQICGIRNFGQGRDLVLTMVSGQNQFFLDDDETVLEVSRQLSGQIKENENFMKRASFRGTIFNSFSQNFETKEQNKNKIRLVLRKLYTFHKNIQEKMCQNQIQKYQLLLGQILHRFRIGKLFTNVSQVKYLCSYFYMIEKFSQLSFSKKIFFNEEILKHYLPEQKWNFISSQFVKQCQKIVSEEMQVTKDLTWLYKKIHNKFVDAPGWKHTLFEVSGLEDIHKNLPKIYIGVGMDGIVVFEPIATKIISQLKYGQFQAVFSGDLAWIITDNQTSKFKGHNFMTLETLMNRYRKIYQFSMLGNTN